jgi:DNA mismatch endonuclease (patch repair protein)
LKKNKPYILPKVAVAQFCEENGFYTTAQRSYNMSRIRSKGTKPEILLKKALWQAGIRYKAPKKPLPGKPDISLKKYKLVIFVDGTFWHGYEGWNVLRFWDFEVKGELGVCIKKVLSFLY